MPELPEVQTTIDGIKPYLLNKKIIACKISVKKLDNEIIKINGQKLNAEKYTLKASKNPKDLGPFPKYTLWYYGDELIQFKFKHPKDKKIVTTVRNDWPK